MSEVERKLAAAGVFAGLSGLEGLANASEFWDDGATWFAVDASELRAVDRWAHIPTGEAQQAQRQLFGGAA